MKLTDKQKAEKLRQAMELLEDADVLIQEALGDSDACEDIHNRIQDIVDDLRYDVIEFDDLEPK